MGIVPETDGPRSAFAPRPRPAVRVLVAFGALVPVLLAAGIAAAQSVNEIQVGGDTVTGSIGGDGEVDRVPFRLVDGSVYSLQLQAAKKSPLLPDLTVLGVDRLPDGAAAAAMVVAKKGNKVVLKNLPVVGTGLRYVEVRGTDGTAGDWILKTKVKHPKGVLLAGTAPGGAPVSLPFTCPGNATTTMVVKAVKGSGALPVLDSVLDPNGSPMIVDDLVATSAGFTVKNLLLGKPGQYTLKVGSASAGDFTVKTKWKIPKPVKRELLDSQIVTLPVLLSVDPTGGDTSQSFPVSLDVDFALPGAQVAFRKVPTVVTVPGSQVTVSAHSADFLLNLASFQQGIYDVELTNPDGGKDSLLQVFTVENAPPSPASINPPFGNDNQVVRASVTGSFFQSGATVKLRRGAEEIVGTDLFVSSGQISADFDLRGRTVAFWDVVVTNPGPQTATLPGAFEIKNSPPTLTSMDPRRSLDDPVFDAVIAGADFDPTPTVVLRKSGESDIPGTALDLVSGVELHATFDTTGAATGAWDLVLANPDAQQATLAGAFTVSGPVGPAVNVLSAGYEADSPPSVVYNPDREEFALAWVDVNNGATAWTVYIQRADDTGTALGSRVSVSSSASSVEKRDAVVAWDSTNNEYLVSWAEIVSVNATNNPPTGNGTQNFFEVFAQRFTASGLSAQGSNVQVTDATKSVGGVINEFDNFRPAALWDSKNGYWNVIWMQEWDTTGNYSYDDYDVLMRTLDRSGNLGTVTAVATNPYHEGDPSLCWDPVGEQVLVLFNRRGSSDSVPMDLYLGSSVLVSAVSDDLVDPRAVVDPDSGRVLVTWTKLPSSGARTVEAILADRSTLAAIGSPTTVGSGNGDHFLARPLYNGSTKEGLLAWTRLDSSGYLSVRHRRVDTAPAAGLALVGSESEISGGSYDEAAPASVTNSTAGESVVFWMKTMNLVTTGSYKGSVVPGTYRGQEFWLQRLK